MAYKVDLHRKKGRKLYCEINEIFFIPVALSHFSILVWNFLQSNSVSFGSVDPVVVLAAAIVVLATAAVVLAAAMVVLGTVVVV